MAEKTDIGRLASPSILKLASETMPLSKSNDGSSDAKTSVQIWDNFEHVLMVSPFFSHTLLNSHLSRNLNE